MLNHEIKIFYIFKSLYETGSATQVAKTYSLSPSKMSRYISQLRIISMDTLFIRKKNHFIPTKKAQLLYPKICDAISAIEKIDINTNKLVTDCVIALPATLSVGLPEHLNKLLNKHNIKMNLSVISSNRDVCNKVMDGSVNIAVTNKKCLSQCASRNTCKLTATPVAHGEFLYVIAHKESSMWQKPLSLSNIANYPFVVTQASGFNDDIDPFEEYCKANDIKLNVLMRAQNLASTIEILTSETYHPVSFIGPHSAIKFLSNIQSLRIEKLPDIEYNKLHEDVNKPVYMILSLTNKMKILPNFIVNEISYFIEKSVS